MPEPNRRRSTAKSAIAQAIDIQIVLAKDALNEKTPANVRAQVSRAWCDLEECKRILRGKPSPGSYRPGPPEDKQAKSLAPVMSEG